MGVRPIPRKLLIHTVEYHEKVEDSRYSVGYSSPITINNVLTSLSRQVTASNSVRNGASENRVMKGMLFIDCVYSSPAMELKPQSKIIFEGQEFYVLKVTPIYAVSLHHYEVELT